MALEYIRGQTADGMKGNIRMIKNMVLEFIPGQTGESIKENGKMTKGMARVNTLLIKII